MQVIARVENEFKKKFALPRQAGLTEGLLSTIVFEKEFRVKEALRGLEGYSHIWLIWGFHDNKKEGWSPTVRPPRLGGNKRMGVFATRSPYRPNPIGLSCVELKEIRETKDRGWVLIVSGADMMDGTPVYDIKPYLPFADSIPDARAGFAGEHEKDGLQVECPEEMLRQFSPQEQMTLLSLLSQDPRPHYQQDENRVYGFPFAGREVRFRVAGNVLFVCEVTQG
ncbi:MAG: tRNA (N6-threonylcarbamoyladenosine(37)-N6)-methyltransferase TrmO [Clostridia bacterium]|nr:tRNA (N6-threonylcarbamoyladenosine(37)-N6)-methyltransferase TrmO [Clostridia bacterium]